MERTELEILSKNEVRNIKFPEENPKHWETREFGLETLINFGHPVNELQRLSNQELNEIVCQMCVRENYQGSVPWEHRPYIPEVLRYGDGAWATEKHVEAVDIGAIKMLERITRTNFPRRYSGERGFVPRLSKRAKDQISEQTAKKIDSFFYSAPFHDHLPYCDLCRLRQIRDVLEMNPSPSDLAYMYFSAQYIPISSIFHLASFMPKWSLIYFELADLRGPLDVLNNLDENDSFFQKIWSNVVKGDTPSERKNDLISKLNEHFLGFYPDFFFNDSFYSEKRNWRSLDMEAISHRYYKGKMTDGLRKVYPKESPDDYSWHVSSRNFDMKAYLSDLYMFNKLVGPPKKEDFENFLNCYEGKHKDTKLRKEIKDTFGDNWGK